MFCSGNIPTDLGFGTLGIGNLQISKQQWDTCTRPPIASLLVHAAIEKMHGIIWKIGR